MTRTAGDCPAQTWERIFLARWRTFFDGQRFIAIGKLLLVGSTALPPHRAFRFYHSIVARYQRKKPNNNSRKARDVDE
jgi:hypothetical protein